MKHTPSGIPATYSEAPSRVVTFEDSSLEEMSPSLKSKLRAFEFPSLLGSIDYCESYADPPISRAACFLERTGEIRQALCYQGRKWAGLFREVEIPGQIDPDNDLVQQLVKKHEPDILTLSLQPKRSFPEYAAGRRLLEVRCTADDYRIDLPLTPDEYLSQLGKQTRKHVPYYLRRLKREWEGRCSIDIGAGTEISWESFVRIIEMNQLRMRAKGRASLWSPKRAKHRWPLVRRRGLVVSVRLENTIAGATLSFVYGREAYLIVIAHDPQYDRLSIGGICLWKTIEHLIRARYSVFHLLWGASSYKEQFGGRRVPLCRVSYSANFIAKTLARSSNLLQIPQSMILGRKIAGRLAGYINSSRMPRHYEEPRE